MDLSNKVAGRGVALAFNYNNNGVNDNHYNDDNANHNLRAVGSPEPLPLLIGKRFTPTAEALSA